MKKFALKHPLATSFITFLIIFIGGSVAGFIIGFLIMVMNPCKPTSPSDPCDGSAMAAGMIWSLSFTASFILGIIGSIAMFVVLLMKIRSLENKFYE
jgi:hypothetical protein